MTLQIPKGNFLLVVVFLAAGIGAGIFVATLTGGDASPSADGGSFGNVTEASLDSATKGLCDMRVGLQAGDVTAARAAFYDKSHLFLHQLAAEVQAKNIEQATGLLVAKYRVEDLIGSSTAPTSVGPEGLEAVSGLIEQVQQSAQVLGLRAPACLQGG